MGLLDDLGAKLVRLKEAAEARQATVVAGRQPKLLTDEEVAQGHPKVAVSSGFQGAAYETRQGGWFGWFWLIFTCLHCAALFYGLSRGSLRMNGRIVEHAAWWHYLGLVALYVPFFLIGFAFTLARYRVELTDDQVLVRWRILPAVGWTWTLPAGDAVKVTLAYRGSSQNKKPVESIVITSLGKETHFGAFLPVDVKDFLAGAIRHYYGEPADEAVSTPFIPND